ncbi:MAG: FAD-dependent monooxygenase [Pseudomonadota bacterium]
MTFEPVGIIGCGPIGLAGALLLDRLGVPSLLLERRSELNPHPRSRFVDVGTMELMRVLGVEQAVEATGLGPDWTACNRWLSSLVGDEHAAIAAPTFHTVPGPNSPCLPVMTCQDYVERELLQAVRRSKLIDCRFSTEVRGLERLNDGVSLRLRDLTQETESTVICSYLIGADGPRSPTRKFIGSTLETDPLANYSQDVIFKADLAAHVGERKAPLLYCMTEAGVCVFQPLDGKQRWRIQLFKPQPEELTEAEILQRIRLAIGDDSVDIELTSIGHWQPTPGCATTMRDGRIFLAGDAAHVSVPTGGMGNNIGFWGIRNLAWKLAYTLHGLATDAILATYEEELRPAATQRIAHGVNISRGMGVLIRGIYSGADLADGIAATRYYADYDNVILGQEISSSLVADEKAPAPTGDPVAGFEPCVRGGRRAPHVWLDAQQSRSLLDEFLTRYTLVAGAGVDQQRWQRAIDARDEGARVAVVGLSPQVDSTIYARDALVLVRPDGVIADHWRDGDVSDDDAFERLARTLPTKAPTWTPLNTGTDHGAR